MMTSTSFQRLTRISLGLMAGLGVSSVLGTQPVVAQATNADPLQDFRTQDGGSDPFSASGSTSTLFDMFHRARLGNNRDMKEFVLEQRQNIYDEASDFRKRQLELLQPEQQPVPVDATPTAN